MRSIGLIILALIMPGAPAAQLYDDFSNINWTPFSTTGVNVYEQQGRLKIDFLRSAAGELIRGGYISTCHLSGDFDITADYYAPTYPIGNGVGVGLALTFDNDPIDYQYALSARVEDAGRSYYTSDFIQDMTFRTEPTSGDKSGKLRLKRIGSQLNGYYWDKSSLRWIQTGQRLNYPGGPAFFMLAAWTHDYLFQDVAVKISFDNVRILSGACSKPI